MRRLCGPRDREQVILTGFRPSDLLRPVAPRIALPRIPLLLQVVIGLLGLVTTAPSPADAQPVLVELEVSESTDGLVEDRFRSAISDLDGVDVASGSALAHYVLTVVILCVPENRNCDAAESLNASVILSEPLTDAQLRRGLGRTGDSALEGWDPPPEAAAFLQRFRTMHSVWATSWDREGFGEEVDRLVRGLDARCFQQRRAREARRRSLLERGDTTAARSLPLELDPTGRTLC